MERRVIDMEKDPRREQFQLFSGYAFPYAGVTVQLDVTALELRLRAEQLTGLIDALGGAFGLIFGMTGACGLLLLISISSALGVVTG